MASTSRYQSRVLSYLRHQSRQLRDRTLYQFRQSRQMLSWGMQIVLYPVYVLFQSGRLVGYRLQQAVAQVRPLLEAVKDDAFDPTVGAPPLRADAPLEKTLQFLESWGLPVTFSPVLWPVLHHEALPSAQPVDDAAHRLTGISDHQAHNASAQLVVQDATADVVNVAQLIRGVACLMDGQSLVLVDSQNRVLDVLTPWQQLQLHRYMLYETASYYRSLRLRLAAQTARSHLSALAGAWGWRFLPPPRPHRAMLPPVRKFWQLMGWMQTQPVAIAANLFRETALVPSRSRAPSLRPSPQFPGIAPALPPGNMVAGGLPGDDSVVFKGHPQAQTQPSFFQRLLQGLSWFSSPPSELPSNAQLDRNLNVWFDPDYQGFSAAQESARFEPYHSSSFDDDWMGVQPRNPETSAGPPSQLNRQRWTPSWMEGVPVGDSLVMDPAVMGQAVVKSIPLRSAAVQDDADNGWPGQPHATPEQSRDGGAIATSQASPASGADTGADLMTTLVDTKATLVGYEKHPLELLLEWVDMGLVWVETLASRIWTWLRQTLQ